MMEELEAVNRRMEKINNSKRKLFELLEEDILTTQEFLTRKDELVKEEEKLYEQKNELDEKVRYLGVGEVNYDEVRKILSCIKPLLEKMDTEQLRILLQLMVESIQISDTQPRQITNINIKLNKVLVDYLSKEDSSKGGSSFSINLTKENIYLQI